jgi:L-ascorbate metabolism protein UlaG (beta-lactamase superfamily)
MRFSVAGMLVVLLSVVLAGCTLVPSKRPTPPQAPGPTAAEKTGKVTLYYEGNAQVEIISPGGNRVLIDVYNPNALSNPATAQDVLLTTHTHGDHVNGAFLKSFLGQQLYTQEGTIELPDVSIRGIASAHNAADTPQPKGGTNYIYLIDVAGLRIAHMGDIGQDALTSEQLATLGKVDIAITQFDNSYSAMSVANKKGFNLVDQLKPRLIIPTHNSADAAKIEGERWPTLYSERPSVSIGREDLTDETRIVYLGSSAKAFGGLTKATQVDW